MTLSYSTAPISHPTTQKIETTELFYDLTGVQHGSWQCKHSINSWLLGLLLVLQVPLSQGLLRKLAIWRRLLCLSTSRSLGQRQKEQRGCPVSCIGIYFRFSISPPEDHLWGLEALKPEQVTGADTQAQSSDSSGPRVKEQTSFHAWKRTYSH